MRIIIIIFVCLSGKTMLGGMLNIDKIKYFINAYRVTNLSEQEYLSYIQRGRDTVSSLINKNFDQLALDQRKTYLSEIISCIWYLYGLAVNKNQGFVDGVIILDDNDQIFYNFLYEYIRGVNSKGLAKRSLITANPYGYGRCSTHFPNDQKTFMHYGIDIRLTNDRTAQKFLPGNKAHILFGRLANGLTFIKMERYGLYYKDGFIGHVGGYLRLVLSRVASRFIAQKERLLHRKEYMPQWIIKSCKKSSKRAYPLTTIKDVVAKNHYNKNLDTLIKKIYSSYDHVSLRYGNEVILGKNEITAHL